MKIRDVTLDKRIFVEDSPFVGIYRCQVQKVRQPAWNFLELWSTNDDHDEISTNNVSNIFLTPVVNNITQTC